MNENDEDVVHAGIVSKSPKNPRIQADFVIRHPQATSLATSPVPPTPSGPDH
jgi:hypothetical protein